MISLWKMGGALEAPRRLETAAPWFLPGFQIQNPSWFPASDWQSAHLSVKVPAQVIE
jgi:hypothetical protein